MAQNEEVKKQYEEEAKVCSFQDVIAPEYDPMILY